MAEHVGYVALFDLVHGNLELESVGPTFGHLATCAECTDRLHAVREVRDDFDRAWDESMRPMGAPGDAGFSIKLQVVLDRLRRMARIIAPETILPDHTAFHLPIPSGAGGETPQVPPAQAEFRIVSPQLGTATVLADSDAGTLVVLLRPPSGLPPVRLLSESQPRVRLLRAETGERREAPFTLVEGAPYLLAEFGDLPGAHWSVLIEGR